MTSFQATGLKPEILAAITELGFKNPTPIQAQTIPYLLGNEGDLVALAQTGTGKTAGFGLPLIQLIQPKGRHVQALILCPTRELCLQIADDLHAFAKNLPKVRIVPVYGGANINPQIRALQRGAQIVVGTPGRTLDLIRQGYLKIRNLDMLVLDEADEMLDRGFKHDVDAILSTAPPERRTWLFSATMPEEIARISREFLTDPHRISVGELNSGSKNVSHEYYFHPNRGRYDFLRLMLRAYGNVYGIVFCRTKRKAREVARRLVRDGFKAEALQGDMSQAARDKAMARFRSQKARILVATDVAARGVDVDNLTHVINFNLPDVDEVYIHRSGRTGRAQRTGISVAILEHQEQWRIKDLERLAKKEFTLKTLEEIVPVNGVSASQNGSNGHAESVNGNGQHTNGTKVNVDKSGLSGSTSQEDWPEDEWWDELESQPKVVEQPSGNGHDSQNGQHQTKSQATVDKQDIHYKAVYDVLDRILESHHTDPELIKQLPLIRGYLAETTKDELINRLMAYLADQGAFYGQEKARRNKKKDSSRSDGNKPKRGHSSKRRSNRRGGPQSKKRY